MQILTSVRNERSLHRAERVNPTTRSWIPPRTFFTQVRFLRPGEKPPRPGPPAPPSEPENAGQKGQKSRPPGQLSGLPRGPPRGPGAAWAETSRRRGKPGPSGGPENGPENRPRDHPEPREEAAPPRRKYLGIPPPQPAGQSARPVLKISSRTSSQPPEHAGARCRREEGRGSGPGRRGLPHTQPGKGKGERPRPARGSPTSSGRRNRTASSQRRRRAAPATPQTSRRGRCWMSPGPRPSGPAHLPSAPEGPGRPPPRDRAPREPRSRSPTDPGPTATGGRQPEPHSSGMELMTK